MRLQPKENMKIEIKIEFDLVILDIFLHNNLIYKSVENNKFRFPFPNNSTINKTRIKKILE